MSYIPTQKFTFRKIIMNSDLSGGAITIDHNLREDYPIVMIYNNDREVIHPDGILSLDENSVYIVLSSFGNIVGNWCIALSK